MDQPKLITTPFAQDAPAGAVDPIPETLAPSDPIQNASWTAGFPNVTMIPLAAGGIPPRGQSMNGVLKAISEHSAYVGGGGQYKWDQDWVDAKGGYAKGAVLQSDDGLASYVSAVDNNTDNFNTDPASIGTSWFPYSGAVKIDSAGTGLIQDGTALRVNFGATTGTVMQGNDSRVDGALQKTAVVQSTGTSTTEVMSQKAVTDALNAATDHPTMTGTATLNGSIDNTVELTDIVTTLALEVGDVIRIAYTGYDKLHSVESIADNSNIIVNYEHAGNRGDGSLKLPDTTATATITRIAKWYNAPIGLGQDWVDVTAFRSNDIVVVNSTGRPIQVVAHFSNSVSSTIYLYINGNSSNGMRIGDSGGSFGVNHSGTVSGVVSDGQSYCSYLNAGTGRNHRELR